MEIGDIMGDIINFKFDNIGKVKNANLKLDGISVIAGYNNSGKSTITKGVQLLLFSFLNLEVRAQNSRLNSISNVLDTFIQSDFEFMINNNTSRKQRLEVARIIYKSYIDNKSFSENDLEKIIYENFDFIKKLELQDIQDLYIKITPLLSKSIEEYKRFICEMAIREYFGDDICTLNCIDSTKLMFSINNAQYRIKIQPGNIFLHSNTTLKNIKSQYIVSSLDSLYNNNMIFNSNRPVYTLEKHQQIQEKTNIINEILTSCMNGSLKVENGRIYFYDNDYNYNFDLKNTASGLRLPMVIQRVLEVNDFNSDLVLLVDEPEVNAHPELQIKIAEIFVLLCKELDIKILLNSHSPYFIRAIQILSAKHKIADRCNYYFLEQKNKLSTLKDVTNNTEYIYQTMYKPLEEL